VNTYEYIYHMRDDAAAAVRLAGLGLGLGKKEIYIFYHLKMLN